MKTKIVLLFLAGLVALFSSGCIISPAKVGRDYAAFVREIPAAKITDVSTVTQSPLWTFNASASGISTDPKTGIMTITNGKAAFSIPLWGFSKTFSVSGLEFQATQEQLAAANALKAAAQPSTDPNTK